MSRKKAPWIQNARDFTNKTYGVWLNKLYNIAISRFEWLDLPPTCDERFIEMTLLFNARMVGFKDPDLDAYLILPCVNDGTLNLMGYPARVMAYGYNGYQFPNLIPYNALYTAGTIDTEKPNSALLYANYAQAPEYPFILYYAKKLAMIDRTIDVNMNVQKTPWLITCDENTRLTVLNALKKVDDFENAIVGTKFFDPNMNNPFKVLNLDAPFISDKLQTVKRQIWQEALTVLGIEANTSEKAERQVTGELTANQGETEALRQSPLAARRIFCDQFNAVFGTNVSVRFRSNLELSLIMDGDEENANVLHNDVEGNLRTVDGENEDK